MTGTSTALIDLDLETPAGRIDERLFGLHVEHIWTCVYPSIWVGPESEAANVDGIRADVATALAALRPTLCKYPGGYFSDFYDWRDGVGPRQERPARVYPNEPSKIETNAFGTGEFVTFCRLIGAEPYFSVNTTSISPATAAHWVEYCNGTGDTEWARRRRRDGYRDPLNVRYWAIGNEPYWLHGPETYAEVYRTWVHWMYNTDPDIRIVAGGIEPGLESMRKSPNNRDGRWGERFVEASGSAGRLFSGSWHRPAAERQIFYSYHPYFGGEPECSHEQYRESMAELETRLPETIRRAVELLDQHREGRPRPQLCFDEYGLVFPGYPMDGNMTQPTPFWAALWLATFLHICFEHHQYVDIATLPGPVNMEHELLVLNGETLIRTPSYHLFKLFRAHGGADRLHCAVEGAAPAAGDVTMTLRCAASRNPASGQVTVSLINRDLERDTPVRLLPTGGRVGNAGAVSLTAPSLHTENTAAAPDQVQPQPLPVSVGKDGALDCVLPHHSIVVIELDA